MKQNKNSSVIRFLAFVTALVVFFFSISIPSFAAASGFSDQPIPVILNPAYDAATFDASFLYYDFTNGQGRRFTRAISSDTDNTYVFLAVDEEELVICCPTSFSAFNIAYTYYTDSYASNATPAAPVLDAISNLYVTDVPMIASQSSGLVPSYADKASGLAAVADYISNPPAPVPDPQGPLNISIPCGNALFIDISDLTGLTGSLSTQTSQSHSSPFSWNSTLSYTDTVPSSGSPVGNPINWVGTGGTDVFGRYRSWTCNLIIQPNKKYIAITNPFFNSSYLDPEHEDTNFPITVSLSNYRDYFFVPLNAQYVNGEGVQNSYTDEQTQAPTPGGNNTTTTGNSINDFLQNIASSISGFFQGAIGAVSTLVSAGADFMRSVSGLYTWLPAPVYTVLTSAIILVITIGVIKVFI